MHNTYHSYQVTIFCFCCGSGSGIRCLFDPWFRMGKNNDPDQGSGSGAGIILALDPGWEKVDTG
jgi:hypothetical protein